MSRRLAPAEGSARPYLHAPKPRSRAPATRLRVSSPARMRSTSTSGEASVDVARQMPMQHGRCKKSWPQLSLTTAWSRRAEARGSCRAFGERNRHMADNGPILVTGAAGQLGAVGRTVCGLLLDRGLLVRAMVRREDDRAAALRAVGAEVVVGDLLEPADVYRVVSGCRR